jgi:hypothetical protein
VRKIAKFKNLKEDNKVNQKSKILNKSNIREVQMQSKEKN